jgi:hypothetical protein
MGRQDNLPAGPFSRMSNYFSSLRLPASPP